MDQDDKVNLSDLNKPKKINKLPKLKNPFKKQQGLQRDSLGQFATGGGGLQFGKKLDLKRMVPVVAIVALVGGFFVFRSFAGSKLYAYQYGIANCNINGSTKEVKEATCRDKSAEALTYRFYKGLFGRDPDNGGYKFWTQKLAGDRLSPGEVARQMIGTNKTLQQKSNLQFVDDLYKKMLQRSADASGKKYWVDQLNAKKWSRERMAAHFALTGEAINSQASSLVQYIKRLPKGTKEVAVAETAKTKQKQREGQAKIYAHNVTREYDGISRLVTEGRKARDAARATAGKAKPTRGDLTSIANNDKAVKSYLSRTDGPNQKIQDATNKAVALAKQARAVAAYSPDIPDTVVKNEVARVQFLSAASNNIRKDLNTLIGHITGAYKTAEGKYEAEQKRIAEEQARQASQQGSGGSQGQAGGSQPQGWFATPRGNCAAGYGAVGGYISLEHNADGSNKRVRADATTCRNSSNNSYNITKAQNVCSAPYVARRINSTLIVGGNFYRNAPDGWVCFRGDKSQLLTGR